MLEDALVYVEYRLGPPADFEARLGARGSMIGWGWTVDEALEDLARVVRCHRCETVPEPVRASQIRTVGWLRARVTDPLVDWGCDR